MMYELPAAPLSIGGVIDSAIRFYRDSIRRCWVLVLLYSLVIGAFSVTWTLILAKTVGFVTPGARLPRQALGAVLSPGVIAGCAVAFLVSLVFYGALLKTLTTLAHGNPSVTLGSALAAGVRRIPGIVLGSVLYGVAIMIGFVLLVIPGIYLIGKLPLWIVAMFEEETGAVNAGRISWRLTNGHWWRTSIILTVALVMLYVFGLAIGLVSGLLTGLTHLGTVENLMISQLLSIASNMIVLPLFVNILIVMYHDLKLRSEGGDLAARMGALGKV